MDEQRHQAAPHDSLPGPTQQTSCRAITTARKEKKHPHAADKGTKFVQARRQDSYHTTRQRDYDQENLQGTSMQLGKHAERCVGHGSPHLGQVRRVAQCR